MASVKAVLYTSKTLKNGEHPIMIRYIKDRKTKYVGIGHSCSKDMWDTKNNCPKKKHPLKLELETLIDKKINEIKKLLLEYEKIDKELSHEEFAQKLKKNTSSHTFHSFTKEVINRHKEINKIGTANAFLDMLRAVKKFVPKNNNLRFHEIDFIFLNKMEEHLLKRGVSENSIAVYMRSLRSIYNKAIKEGITQQSSYPFKDYKISKLDTRTKKRALNKEHIRLIKNLKLEPYSKTWNAQNIFMFSYYCRGINFRDIAFLKWENIINDRLIYSRKKTGTNFNIELMEPVLEILDFYDKIRDNSGYVFTILNETHNTPTKIENRIKRMIKQTNRELKNIGELAGLNIKLTTYVARHTYATVLKKSGVSTSLISESLGHSAEKITQVYLDSFDNEVLDEIGKNLL